VNAVITDNNVTRTARGRVFYDAECSLCGALAERLRAPLSRRGIVLLPLQADGVPERLGIRSPDLLKEMRFLTRTGELFGGAEAVVRIARHIWWGWPLFALGRVPGAMPLMARIYRALPRRRNCGDGACRVKRPGQWPGWLPLAVIPGAALAMKPVLPAWGFMWAMAVAIYLGCKWLTWWKTWQAGWRPGAGSTFAYLLAWPGMDAKGFLGGRCGRSTTYGDDERCDRRAEFRCGVAPMRPEPPGLVEWSLAASKTLFGVALIWGVARLIPLTLLAGWVGLLGLVFLLHFGVFHLLALLWRRSGVNAEPIMRTPIRARSLAEFWGKRWNAASHQLAHEYAFKPLRRILGPNGATLSVFLISGLIHEMVISLPASGGYGLPTAYFLLQGCGLLFERSRTGRWLRLGGGLRGWIFTVVCVASPAFWLFHPPFIRQVILPFLRAIGAR